MTFIIYEGDMNINYYLPLCFCDHIVTQHFYGDSVLIQRHFEVPHKTLYRMCFTYRDGEQKKCFTDVNPTKLLLKLLVWGRETLGVKRQKTICFLLFF